MNRRVFALTVFAVLVVAALTPLFAQPGSSAKVIRVTFDNDRDAETSIAINPTNSRNVLAGWISQADLTCGYGVSFDGGSTWPLVGVIPGIQKQSGGQFDRGTDPSVVFDKNGNAYYTVLAFDLFPPGTGSAGTIFVSKSTDGGVTWGAPVVAMAGLQVNEFQDHQFITANPVNGHLYVTETQFTAFGKPQILFARSADGGQTWAAPVRINDFAGNASFQDSYSAVGQDPQTIYLTFGAFSNAGLSNWNRIYIAKSTDGGASFSRPQLLATITPLPDPLPNASWRSDNNLWVAVDRSTNQIYVSYADYNAGDADIRAMRVLDTGNTFAVQGITRVNDDGPGSDQFFPFITVAPGGRVDVCFQDRRYAPGNALIFTTCACSQDAGLSFTNQQVTTTPFDASNNNFIGDYNWQASTRQMVMPIFVGDGVPGGDQNAQEVFVARVDPTMGTKAGATSKLSASLGETRPPESFQAVQNYPNPFNPETAIRFLLPEASHVVVKIFNTAGEEIRTLANAQYEAGGHMIRWDGKDRAGNPVASGVYFYQLQAGTFFEMKKMTLIR